MSENIAKNSQQEPAPALDADRQTIAYAGWTLSSGQKGSRDIYSALDLKGEIANALKKHGFKEGGLDSKYHFKMSEAYAANGLAMASSGKHIRILPEAKDLLDRMCGMDIAKPDHSNIEFQKMHKSSGKNSPVRD